MDALGSNPTNLQEVIFFLLPGFLTILLFYYQVPDKRKTDLTVTVLSVSASVILTYLTALLFTLLALRPSGFAFDMTKIFLAVISAVGSARFVQSRAFIFVNKKIFHVDAYPFGRLWNSFFKTNHTIVVKVILQDGSGYIGVVKRSSFNPNDDVQELELANPYTFDKETGEIFRLEETDHVLILGTSIMSVEKIKEKEAAKLYAPIET